MKALSLRILPLVILRHHSGIHSFLFPILSNSRLTSTSTSTLAFRPASSSKWTSGPLHVAIQSDNDSPRDGAATDTALEYHTMTTLPRHPTNAESNAILAQTERALRALQEDCVPLAAGDEARAALDDDADRAAESVYANSYVDLGAVDTVGFDYDYTLVTYSNDLLSLIYDMALTRLVEEKEYPRGMLAAGLRFDPFFSIR